MRGGDHAAGRAADRARTSTCSTRAGGCCHASGGLGGQALRGPRALRAAHAGPARPRRCPSRGARRSRRTRPAPRSPAAGSTARIAADSSLWIDVWAGRVLSRRERELFAGADAAAERGGSSGWRRGRPPRSASSSCWQRPTASSWRRPTSRYSRTSAGRRVVHVAALGAGAPAAGVAVPHGRAGRGARDARGRRRRRAWGSTSSCFRARPAAGSQAALRRGGAAAARRAGRAGGMAAAPVVRPRGGRQRRSGRASPSSEHQPRARALDPARGEVVVEVGERTLVASAPARRRTDRGECAERRRGPGGGGIEMSAIAPGRDGRHPGAAGRGARRLGVRRARSARTHVSSATSASSRWRS